jgi:hypothetical protein
MSSVATIILAAFLLAACSPPQEPGSAAGVAAQLLASPAGPGSMAPRLAVTGDGRAVLSWLEPLGEERWALKYALQEGEGWDAARRAPCR